MKQLERFNLIDKVAAELQARMTYDDIGLYLAGYGIDRTVLKHRSYSSKRTYSKELLSHQQDKIILQIAEELEVDVPSQITPESQTISSGYWAPNHYRLFLSHLASFKVTTFQLKTALENYGISAFVAHESIEPTQEWQDEIEKALFSMDAMATLLMPGFVESRWTDQEVGIAIGRNVIVIPVRKGLDPYGFLGKVQGIQAEGKTVRQVAERIFQVISRNPRSSGRMAEVLVGLAVGERDLARLTHRIELLKQIDKIPKEHLQTLQKQLPENEVAMQSPEVDKLVNGLLKKYGLDVLQGKPDETFDEDIPF